jgi:hypothetical protein
MRVILDLAYCNGGHSTKEATETVAVVIPEARATARICTASFGVYMRRTTVPG